MAEKKKTYNFGEKKEENIKGIKVPVEFHTPKFKEARDKAIELLESEKYKNVLKESDFWILVNTYANKTKAMYSGLILSHDGCLKINDALEDKLKFKPECISIDKEGYNGSLVYIYNCKEQGLYEVGEVSNRNCQNDYPYAMAFKRCFDRVVLKNSKIAYSGIYSDSEADDFKETDEHKTTQTDDDKKVTKKTVAKTEKKEEKSKGSKLPIQDSQIEIIKKMYTAQELIPYMKKYKKVKLTELSLIEASELIKLKTIQK